MCLYHDSESNREASDGSLPGMWKLVIVLNNISSLFLPILSPTSLMNLASRVSRFGRHSPKKNPICSPLGFLQSRKSPKERSLSTGCPSENCWNLPMPSSTRDLNSPMFWGNTSKPPINHLGRKNLASSIHLHFLLKYLSEKRETRIMRDAAMVMTAQRTDRTLTMMVQHIFTFYSTSLQRLASTPPGNLPHRAVCYDCPLRMRPLKRRWRSSLLAG